MIKYINLLAGSPDRREKDKDIVALLIFGFIMLGLMSVWSNSGVSMIGCVFIAASFVVIESANRCRSRIGSILPLSVGRRAASVIFGCLLIALVVLAVIGAIIYLVKFALIKNAGSNYNISYNLPGIIMEILVCIFMYLICSVVSFLSNVKKRNVIIIVMWAIFAIAFITLRSRVNVLSGYRGELDIADILGYFITPVSIAVLAVVDVITAIVCYKVAVGLLKNDNYAQTHLSIDDDNMMKVYKTNSPMDDMDSNSNKYNHIGRNIAIVIILVCVIVIPLTLIFNSVAFGNATTKHKVDQEYTDIADYSKWSDICEENDIPDDVFDVDDIYMMFPETVNEDEAEYYNASVSGNWSSDLDDSYWLSLEFTRILVMNYTEDEYKSEEARVSGLTYTCPSEFYDDSENIVGMSGITNTVLKDTTHFSYPAYISEYDETYGDYEYVLFNEEKHQVIYVLYWGEGANMYGLESEYNVYPVTDKSVIDIDNANKDDIGFSIRSFYDYTCGDYQDY